MRWLFVVLIGIHAIFLACLGLLPAEAIPFQALLPNDKMLHFGGFFILAILVFFAWELDRVLHIVALTALPVGALAIVSEIVQPILSPTRTFDSDDIVANVIGTTLGTLVALFVEYVRRKRLPISLLPLTMQQIDDRQSRGQYEAIEMDPPSSVTSQSHQQ
ncbi:hypothetical protein BGW41_001200 [Actinomortierella wolfii]|nr:hypothetical protein BGW41_001200 [Actinomortierella wolfii]